MNMNTDSSIQIYRFKFSQGFQDRMTYFAIQHKYDSKDDFKESWKQWCMVNEESIENETRELMNNGYNGNVMDKMYKSVRYYLKHKTIDDLDKRNDMKKELMKDVEHNSEKKYTKEKQGGTKDVRPYIKIPEYMLVHIDSFIKGNGFNLKPSTQYEEFCKCFKDEMQDVKQYLIEEKLFDTEKVELKMKKTFKNRYFKLKQYMVCCIKNTE